MPDTATPVDPLPTVWDPNSRVGDMLRGRRGLVVGIANEHSIAYGCAVKLRAFGAELAVTYLNERSERYVRPLAAQPSPHFQTTSNILECQRDCETVSAKRAIRGDSLCSGIVGISS